MWEVWEQQCCDQLPLQFNSFIKILILINISVHEKAYKNIDEPYRNILNQEANRITFFIWSLGASENIFEFKSLGNIKVGGNVRS